ncbi:S-formylglutathione hydrolase FrmB [Algoriphagus ratkowskyi]|uniref:Prolyl oligopeptidase family serine peptidase n=1 Tax=Algoriphagus ratkowskyi TaxID=57028 RepID=A0A2W7SR26_9BACT|nr:alpha/beta hydrolase family protein [Algoriphagus ratkowskyi]PZX53122.1 S-formylglutathione hydrolase FrmB [Algoriphagus ratkowskyi]TXD76400.1 prolyl oligopeptidase family serine peptidase [Algoriphagus ratkowskyi]
MKKLLILLVFLPSFVFAQSKVDTIEVFSQAMNKTLKATVTTPSSYDGSKQFATLYLLHGGSGAFSDWHQKVTEPGLVNRMAEQYNLIIVTPGVGPSSYYFDSPVMDSVQYETYITAELIPHVDQAYKTLAKKESRAITGLSMGGHGAIMLSAKHPELFIAATSMSGVMNIDTRIWDVPQDFSSLRQMQQKAMLGEDLQYDSPFSSYTAVGLVDRMKENRTALLMDCGVDDFLLETNRQMHQMLLDNGTAHEYTERPGAHTWEYWTDALPVHLLFINKHLTR